MCSCYGSNIFGQEGNYSSSVSLGVSTPILDNGIGFHIGVNPSYRISPNFSLESQISYIYTQINSSFLSGDSGMINSTNFLLGGRLYIISADRPSRLYINLLVGGNYNKEEVNDDNLFREFKAGFSFGSYFESGHFIVGLSIDSPQNIVLKTGYIF